MKSGVVAVRAATVGVAIVVGWSARFFFALL